MKSKLMSGIESMDTSPIPAGFMKMKFFVLFWVCFFCCFEAEVFKNDSTNTSESLDVFSVLNITLWMYIC
jgi:hypothetical protein